MATTLTQLLKQLRPPYSPTASSTLHRSRFLSFHNATRLFSSAPPPSVEPPAIPPPSLNPRSPLPSSLNQTQLANFADANPGTWWDSEGQFKPLHELNATRLAHIRHMLCDHFRRDPLSDRPFEGLKFLDIGCGGGILSESLARMGASVTGVDAIDKNIKIARLHADLDPMTSSIEYLCTTAEKLVGEQRSYDVVFALEVFEHVANPADFCKSLDALTGRGGATLISSIYRKNGASASSLVQPMFHLCMEEFELKNPFSLFFNLLKKKRTGFWVPLNVDGYNCFDIVPLRYEFGWGWGRLGPSFLPVPPQKEKEHIDSN